VRIPGGGGFGASERGVLRLRICFASQRKYFAQDDRVWWKFLEFIRRTREAGSSAAAPLRNDISLFISRHLSGKRRELYQVSFGDLLYGVAGFAPCGQAAVDYVGAETVLS
jgi:hypothetical protein